MRYLMVLLSLMPTCALAKTGLATAGAAKLPRVCTSMGASLRDVACAWVDGGTGVIILPS
jgi:hypothetical protein